jgi:hypothetical protein
LDELGRVLSGQIKVQCPMTFTRRATREGGRFVDRHPFLGVMSFIPCASLMLLGIVQTFRMFLR